MPPAIKVENLSKLYRIGHLKQRNDTLRDQLVSSMRGIWQRKQAGEDEIWALKDVSFEVQPGEVIGVIGRNGAGKSTLLKILARITEPTRGRAMINGRVGSLLEVGTGFHPELTGRENIYLNGAILGMRRREINQRFDEIIAFSEIEKFLDTPVKRYSSGMYVRLAFAVAAHMEPEILLVDEVLAVGDVAFQKKCLGKMGEVAEGGRTVLFVSHNMGAVSSLCKLTILMVHGKIHTSGLSSSVVPLYLSMVLGNSKQELNSLRLPGHGDDIRIEELTFAAHNGNSVNFGEPLVFNFIISSKKNLQNLSIGSSIFSNNGTCVGSLISRQEFNILAGQTLKMKLTIAHHNLSPGAYYSGFSVGKGGYNSNRVDYEVIIGAPSFQILPMSAGEDLITNWNPRWGNVVFSSVELVVAE